MGVDVVLKRVEQAGTSPKGRRLVQVDVVADGDDLFARLCGRSTLPMLSRVDPYADLVLTQAEMPQLLAELATELGQARSGGERSLVVAVQALAERCATDVGLELHLEGD